MSLGCCLVPAVPSLGTGRRLSLLVSGGPRKKQQSQPNPQPGSGLGFGGPTPAGQRQGKTRKSNKGSGKAATTNKPPVYGLGSVSELTSPVDQWLAAACSAHGRLHVRRHEVSPGLHGLVAAEGISEGDMVLEVPRELSILAYALEENAGFAAAKAAAAVQLLQRREEQRLLPWLRALPNSVPAPFLWSLEELAATHDEEVLVPECLGQRDKLDRACQAQSIYSWDEMAWARSIVMTRSFQLGNALSDAAAVVPGIDFVNHSANPNACMRLDPEPSHKDDSFKFRLVALRNIRPGEEVTIEYIASNRSDEDYLAVYGYLPPHPAGNRLFRNLQHLVERYHHQVLLSLAVGEAASNKQGLDYKEVRHLVDNPGAVFSAANVLLVELAMGGLLQMLLKDQLGLGVEPSGRFHPSLLRAASLVAEAYPDRHFPGKPKGQPGPDPLDFLRNHCKSMLATYPASCDEDAELLAAEGSTMTASMRTAVEFRLRKRAALKAALRLQGQRE